MPPPSTIVRGDKVIVKPIEQVGHWERLFVSPDGKTLLVQWSGACEIRSAYLVAADGGTPRQIVDYAKGSAESAALGWAGDKARVRLPRGQPPSLKPGVYLVDPKTMAMTLERRSAPVGGC